MSTDLCLEPVTESTRCQLLAEHVVPHTDDPTTVTIELPSEPWSEVAPRLWVGSTRVTPEPGQFESVLTLTRTAPYVHAPVIERRIALSDFDAVPVEKLVSAVDWVYQQWSLQKRDTLVRCHTGLNRSGVVAAATLIRDGHDSDDAMRLVRDRRSPLAVCLPAYVDYLRTLA